ncbi:hypothetical protein ASPVEDRAFT_120784 [Aspergillus versicolor CBS 583.65]|uniref:Calcium channel YVC1-like C-terminal transmembrane domain-containing protein n=1 Tax=Aspergillus versicolor CBS 583.65 TaxID=1036611 RepID=A0A1L9P549_ASPVE|nr:uncharacterized protein ASPVEDRAFT_120784 [Aspergillus versicolor CBS 583.65]OJI96655.1 hypothetical protein ASPVEDRAFT_120784 [Aspergillus versicolor CBS 583.65]
MAHESTTSLLPSVDYERFDIPTIEHDELLVDVIQKLHSFFTSSVSEIWCTFEEIKSTPDPRLKLLVNSLVENSHNPCTVPALMILKWKFDKAAEYDGDPNGTRGHMCEYVAWQFLCRLNRHQLIENLLEALRAPFQHTSSVDRGDIAMPTSAVPPLDSNNLMDETAPLLSNFTFDNVFESGGLCGDSLESGPQVSHSDLDSSNSSGGLSMFLGLNALEIATIAYAKKLLSQKVVENVVNDLWNGEIVFWDSLSVHSTKKPQIFNERTADPYSRLRVPVYRKAFEALFFVSFLFLYYAVLIERNPTAIGLFEAILYVWIAAFAYDELSGVVDSGMLFYQMTFWNIWDLCIIGTGLIFVITKHFRYCDSEHDVCIRIFSLVSLNPYFGSLTKAFFRFTPVIIILYLGFLTTFTMLARDRFSVKKMSWILVNVFFGLVFVSVTSLLLISSLVSLMSMSLEGVISHAREEYLFQLAIYVLESSTSNRLTYFLPPLNLIPLLCIRPMRLFLPAEDIRQVRIILLRATHLPCVALLWAYESSRRLFSRKGSLASSNMPRTRSRRPTSMAQDHPRQYCHQTTGFPGIDSHPRRVSPRTRRYTEHGQQRPGHEEVVDMVNEMERLRGQMERVAAAVGIHHRNRQ